jgi:LysM repeat protein
MLRTVCTIGFLAVLAGVGVLLYRHYSLPAPWETTQSEAAPPIEKAAPERVRPTPPPVVEAPPVPPVPVPPVRVAEPAPPPPSAPIVTVGKRTHVVQPGESLWTISKRYYGSAAHVERIADANHLESPKRLRQGQVLLLPEISGVKMAEPDATEAPSVETTARKNSDNTESPQMPPTLSRTVRTEP